MVDNNVNILDDLFESNDPPPKPASKKQEKSEISLEDLLNIDFNQTVITPAIVLKEENPFSISSDNPIMNEILSSYNRPSNFGTIEVIGHLTFRSDQS